MFDIIIIGGGASGLMLGGLLPSGSKKLLIEKTSKLGNKLALAGGGRCNFSNADIELSNYFSSDFGDFTNIFDFYDNNDFIEFLKSNGLDYQQEDRGRLLLKGAKSADLIKLLTDRLHQNNTQVLLDTQCVDISKVSGHYIVRTPDGEFETHKVVITTGGKSFSQLGTDGFGYELASKFGLNVVEPYRGLGNIITAKDLSSLAGISTDSYIEIFDQDTRIYSENSSILFTHTGLSGPAIFNATLAIGHHLRDIGVDQSREDGYVSSNMKVSLVFQDRLLIPRKVIDLLGKKSIILNISRLQPRDACKVTGGGVALTELLPNFESKRNKGLFFVGEVLDFTGKTGGFNLQFCWTSSYICSQGIGL